MYFNDSSVRTTYICVRIYTLIYIYKYNPFRRWKNIADSAKTPIFRLTIDQIKIDISTCDYTATVQIAVAKILISTLHIPKLQE